MIRLHKIDRAAIARNGTYAIKNQMTNHEDNSSIPKKAGGDLIKMSRPRKRLKSLMDDLAHNRDLYFVCTAAIGRAQANKQLFDALQKLEDSLIEIGNKRGERRRDPKDVEREVETANREIDSDYMLTTYQNILMGWSIFETFMCDYVSEMVHKFDPIDEQSSVGLIELRLHQVYRLKKRELAGIAAKKLLEGGLGPQKDGRGNHVSNKLTEALKRYDIVVPENKHMSNALREIYAVRNLIAHNHGRVDRKFVRSCPWRGKSKVGEHVRFYPLDIISYWFTMLWWGIQMHRGYLTKARHKRSHYEKIIALAEETVTQHDWQRSLTERKTRPAKDVVK